MDGTKQEMKRGAEGAATQGGGRVSHASRRKPLRLPFNNRSEDIGGWAFDHRVGLCVMIIAYLLIGIVFLSSKIVIGRKASTQGMYIDLQTVEALKSERDRLAEEVRRANEQIDWSKIRNLSSNENALNENLADSKGTNTAALNSDAKAVEARMRANKEAYEQGLRDAEDVSKRKDDDKKGENKQSDKKVKGSVTVSFSFSNPVRYSRHLIKPAYRCEGGGEVVVKVGIDRAGKVLYAYVEEGGDDCMRQTAIAAAKGSRFDHNQNAPAKQEGEIRYIFIPQ